MTPLRRRPRNLLAAAALVLAAPAVAACGFNVQTDQQYQAAVGVDDRSGSIDVLNALVVTDEQGKGVFVATFVNKSVEQAHKVLSVEAGGQQTTLGQEIPAEGLLNIVDSEPPVTISDPGIEPGTFVSVSIEFDNGQQTTVNAPVVAAEGDYEGIGGLQAPEPAEEPTESASPESDAH